MPTYNGHKNWQYWNVSLWINNDEGLYRMARECKAKYKPLSKAAEALLDSLNEIGNFKTPDGARYTIATIRAAIKEL